MDSQLAYIAGVIDGEGTLCIGKYNAGNKNLCYRPYLAIANTYVPMLEYIKSIIGGKIVEQGKGRGCYSLNLTADKIRRWLPEIFNYLIVKKDQAEVLLDFLDKKSSNASAPISDELLEFYESCYQKLKKLKKKRFIFKESLNSLGIRECAQCGSEFEATSRFPKKIYCNKLCKKKTHWTRSNLRIRSGIKAWSLTRDIA